VCVSAWYRGLSLRAKYLESDHLAPYFAEVKNEGSYTSTLPYAFLACTRKLYFTLLHQNSDLQGHAAHTSYSTAYA
jgi:hypothetical protein